MHLPALISDLAIILLTAAVVTIIFKKIKQPMVLGYILAGFLIGPYMPAFFTVTDNASISTWSEIGIIILMFGLGLEFNLHKLVSVGSTALINAMVGIGGMLILGYVTGQVLGWGMMDSIFLGGMLAMSSTTIVIKAFDELGVSKELGWTQQVFGTLVMQDIAGIFMMIILSTVSVSQNVSGAALAGQLLLLVLYLALWLVLGIFLLPTLLNKTQNFMNDETLLLTSLGICFAMVLLADALGFSSALGAFLAGSLLAGTVHAERVEHLSSSVKDLFGSVFFISVGMMLAPAMIAKYILPILIISVVTIIGKIVFSVLGMILAGQNLRSAVNCGCALSQIGEFAFIIATLGQNLGVIADYIYPIIVSVSVLTTLTTPFFIKGADKIYGVIDRILPSKITAALERNTEEDEKAREQDSDWMIFLRRYIKVTVFYGALMFGITIIGQFVLYPLMQRTPLDAGTNKLICILVCIFGMALFVRPMLDLHSTAYRTLWVKNRIFRLPLTALNIIRVLIIVFIAFFPLQTILNVNPVFLLVIIVAVVLLVYKSKHLNSLYISVETRFLANFNERKLQRTDDGTEWLDEKLYVGYVPCHVGDEIEGKTLKELAWGKHFGVNVIKIIRGRNHLNMPSGDVKILAGDHVYVIGAPEALRSLRLAMNEEDDGDFLPTLRHFVETEGDAASGLYCTAIAVEETENLQGKTIRDSGLRENYDCMILGLQRQKLPILQPDLNMMMAAGDLVWVLGSQQMAEKILASAKA